MVFKTAPMSMAIKVITGLVITGCLTFFGFSVFQPVLLIPAGILLLVTGGCWVTAPISYEVEARLLSVKSKMKTKNLGKISSVENVTEKPALPLKLWANGGLFGGVGIFWCKTWGVFRAYVTSARWEDAVLVRTDKYRTVLITPENPDSFLEELSSN